MSCRREDRYREDGRGSWRDKRKVGGSNWGHRQNKDDEDDNAMNERGRGGSRSNYRRPGRGRGSWNSSGVNGRHSKFSRDNLNGISHKDPSVPKTQENGEDKMDVSSVNVNGSPTKPYDRKFNGDRPVFGFKRIYKYLELSQTEILLSINKDKKEWKDLLESKELTEEKLVIVIEVLGDKICVNTDLLREQQMNAILACCTKSFISKLEDIVSNIFYEKSLSSRRNRPSQEFPVDVSFEKVFSNIYKICEFVVRTMPHNAADYFGGLIMKSSTCASAFPDLHVRFQNLMVELKEAIMKNRKKEEALQKQKQRQRSRGFTKGDMDVFDQDVPPDDIKDIEVIPSMEELRSGRLPFLRPNKEEGAYIDCEHYLDVQFRLLREDFVQPLRNGIQKFLKDDDRHLYISGKEKMPMGELRLYSYVRIIKVVKEFDTVVYKLQLPEHFYKGKKAVKWEKSKRLLTKNLILLTKIEKPFEKDNTFYGTIFSRKEPELRLGVVSVKWEGEPPFYNEGEEFLLFESEVYVEAYRYTLETLKHLELEEFPMKKFIVDASDEVRAPRYLRMDSDIQVKLMGDEKEEIRHVSLDLEEWPSAEEFGLDENQLQAYRAAITSEFSIIQGPPGTGKTFLGLKVAETFLNNSQLWMDPDGSPITVVCYTNHALDQFLEGIVKFDFLDRLRGKADVIRIGGRCQSDALKPYTLENVRRIKGHHLPSDYRTNEVEHMMEISRLERQRASMMSEVTGLLHLEGVVDFEKLRCWEEFNSRYPSVLWNHFKQLTWLGVEGEELMNEWFSVNDLIMTWFRVLTIPKKVERKPQLDAKVIKIEENSNDVVVEDDENYDLDEMLEHRILEENDDFEEINLEALTSQGKSLGNWLPYLPDGSVHHCSMCSERLNNSLLELQKEIRLDNLEQLNEYRNMEMKALVLFNRKTLLEEIFRLHNAHLLELPDISDLLKQIIGSEKEVPFNQLNMDERWALYFAVVEEARMLTMKHVAGVEKDLSKARDELNSLRQYGDGIILRSCDVVGLTTTGAAKYNHLLKQIKSKIVIVEEAAEVFEAHIVTSITEACEQLILIGDHRQLRPNPTVYQLATKYRLDLSMFERMLNNNLHCYQLKVQHRMRPAISDLVRGTIYKELFDHESVTRYPDVKGLTKNVFFITHTEKEKSDTDSSSKSNFYEAKFIAALCRHLILQGYHPEQITVLTMYTGQMFLLKKEVYNYENCKGIRITCVDNFQGEENDIILLSLVRSNEEGNVGFLKVDNRICVSLSRAKHGLYIIGNMAMIQMNSEEWKEIKGKLEDKSSIGDVLELECQNHGTRSTVKGAFDFQRVSPEGGCTKMCDTPLACGHVCGMLCHIFENHDDYKCKKPCQKLCARELHPCAGYCYEKCPPCDVRVERSLQCGHKVMLRCHKEVDTYTCVEPVERTLPCGHKETLACFVDFEEYVCKVKVDRTLYCGHVKTLECHVDPMTIKCKKMVLKELPCGHSQNDECHIAPEDVKCGTVVKITIKNCGHEAEIECCMKDGPITCKGRCITRLDCGHQCVRSCHVDDDPNHVLYKCKKPCGKECAAGHSCKVNHPCWLPCPPCKELMQKNLLCGHKKKLECHIDAESYECQVKCERYLENCGHPCKNRCFEACGPCKILVKARAECGHEHQVLCGQSAFKKDCVELVSAKRVSGCGHPDVKVPCKYDEATPKELVKYCEKPCDYVFNIGDGSCKHTCSGKCNTCFQGRIHLKCQEKCGKQLVCGHPCDFPCSSRCPPCNKPCLMQCKHSSCKKKCGEPCSPCKEKCPWKCKHHQCKKRCGEMCDREPCMEPCPKMLKCRHPCVGYCGEPCPPLCRECDKEELTTIVFGHEDEEDARYIFLPDCKHTIEATALKKFLNLEPEASGSVQIKAKQCPLCKSAIRTCRRFHNLILSSQKDIWEIKHRTFGNHKNANKMRDACIAKVRNNENLKKVFPFGYEQICKHLFDEVRDYRRDNHMKMVPKKIDEFSMISLDFICDSVVKAAGEIESLLSQEKLASEQYAMVVAAFRNTFTLMIDRHPLNEQEIMDFNGELDRNDYFKQLMMRRSLSTCNKGNASAYVFYQNAKKILVSSLPLTPDRKAEFVRIMKELDERLKTGLGINDRERIEIIRAMGMGQGHWFKCPKGHIYVITECGGAMQESACNVCGARIGGGNHQLRGDNALATEMDGATGPAWPTALVRY